MPSDEPVHLVICPKCGKAIEFEKIIEHVDGHSTKQQSHERPSGA